MKNSPLISKILYPTGLAIIALLVFTYIFNPKIDVNGDNCYYYAFATAMAAGEGYVDIAGEPSALFPPGYPLLMTPLRMVTASVFAQKVLNLFFFFASALLLFYTLVELGVKRSLSFIVAAAVLVTPHLLEFATMMMSEASCIFFIALSLFTFGRVDRLMGEKNSIPWRSPWLWVFLVAVVYTFFIRTQAVVFFIAFLLALLVARRFKLSLLLVAVFAVAWLPWALRNSILGLAQSRYMSQIDFSNILGNAKMLVVQSLPESVLPFFTVYYTKSPSLLLYVISVVVLLLVLYGFSKMKHLRVVLPLFLAGNVAIVSIMNTPSCYRYMLIVLPVVTAGLLVGLHGLLEAASARLLKRSFSPWFLLLLFVPMCFMTKDKTKHTIYGLREVAVAPYPPMLKTFLAIGDAVASIPDAKIVASRKPELLYVHTGVRGKRLKEKRTNVDILNHMLDENIDYIVLENMGFTYSYEVLYPFFQQHQVFFEIVKYTNDPVTVLFRFKKEAAERWLQSKGYR